MKLRNSFSFCVLTPCCLLSVFIRIAVADATPREDQQTSEQITHREFLNRDFRTPNTTLFERLPTNHTGINFINRIEMDHPFSLLNTSGFACGGICMGDLNNDHQPDLFLVSGMDKNRLYFQKESFRFEDRSDRLGDQEQNRWGAGAAMIDIDNDGDLDIYVCNYDSPNQLFINEDQGRRFIESAQAYGLNTIDASLMPAFADLDNDGDLDLFLLTNRYYRHGGRPGEPPVDYRNGEPYIFPDYEKYYALLQTGPEHFTIDNAGRADYLYRNNGDGTFTDISQQAGIHERGHGLSATWWDFNTDGLIDLYVSNDYVDPDHLYRNNGDGTFTDVIAETMPYTSMFSMGADCGDINNDGLLDFISVDMAATTHFKSKVTMGDMGDRRWFLENAWPRQTMRNILYLNTGTDRFMEVGFLCNLAQTDWSWTVKMADWDNDGWTDIFVSNGAARMMTDADAPVTSQMLIGRTEWDIWKDKPELKEQNLVFQNRHDLQFKDVSEDWGLNHTGMSFAAAHGDLDGDGDLDLVVANLNEGISVYRNLEEHGHRVTIQLRGTKSNRYGLGATIHLKTRKGQQVRLMNPMKGFLSCNLPMIHFGLGDAETIQELRVMWPGGRQQIWENLPANRHYTITELTHKTPSVADNHGDSDPLFREVSMETGLTFSHRERVFNDYSLQPLLPGKLSQLGPGLAWGDADGDGDEDLYVGGAAGQAGQLFIRNTSGKFTLSQHTGELFRQDKEYEDMAPLWLDIDRDGDFDLFVSSGSVEYPLRSKWLQDRIYINSGHGRFSRADNKILPVSLQSSGTAVAGDLDRDGDLDLFIGSRAYPGKYPTTARSRLLRNDNGKFVDITDTFAAGLRTVGMVTAALWSDANQDGLLDLFLTLEWGPVKIFLNQGNQMVETTEESGLSDRLGWWSGITGTDIDQDGDMDYVVMNTGQNTKYGSPSQKKPLLLYYGDVSNQGALNLVEAKMSDLGLLPVRGRSCSANAMPGIRTKFPTYRGFASSLLSQIYSPQSLNTALELKVTHLESGLLINDGHAKFSWKSLPRLAQASPGYGVISADLDGDGQIEIHAVQNLYTREPETGLWRGGIGFTAIYDSDGNLQLKAPKKTGLIIDGDAKGLALCDLNDDGWPDLTVTQNNDRLLAFQNRGKPENRPLMVKLTGPTGNPSGIGTMVRVHYRDGAIQAAESYAGSGYLSQSTSALFLGHRSAPIESIQIVWPDGISSQLNPKEDDRIIQARHPSLSEIKQ